MSTSVVASSQFKYTTSSLLNNATQITQMDARTLAQAIKSQQVSCREVMQAYLERIDWVNPQINAIVALQDADDLLKQADEKDTLLRQGVYQGFMHGFPHAVKDLDPVKGIVTSMGSRLFQDWLPDFDSLPVARIRSQGAIMIGKTNTPEFGLGSQTYNSVYGVTACAYNTAKTAGGSSGGAAVSLATQILPLADGSDMMGSLRNPAAYNNIIGFRPSQGQIPNVPTQEIWLAQLGIAGPMGRNVLDTAHLFAIQSGYDTRAPLSWAEAWQPNAVLERLKLAKPLNETRIAYLGDLGGYLPMEQGILPLCEQAVTVLSDLGAQIEAPQLGFDFADLWRAWNVLRQFQSAGAFKAWYEVPEKRALMKPELIWEIESGLECSGADIFAASQIRSKWYLALQAQFSRYDYFVLPSAQVFAFDKTMHWPNEVAGKPMRTYHEWMQVVIYATLAGLPAINVPVGFSATGLPMGMQIIGNTQSDWSLLALAQGYEQATDWLDQRPKLFFD